MMLANKKITIQVSGLPKTWILDLDGTIVKHNGYKMDGHDTLLKGVDTLLGQITAEDMVIFITSRDAGLKEMTETFLCAQGIRFDAVIYNAPYGERILINDRKPSGLSTAIAINPSRDQVCTTRLEIDQNL